MSKRGGFDSGPLSWVKSEIDAAFGRASESLAQYQRGFASGTPEASALAAARAHCHQAHGALQIVGIPGISRITTEVEALFDWASHQAGDASSAAFEAIQMAIAKVRTYLDDLMKGAPNQTLQLFPILEKLCYARGAAADPVDLFYPDLAVRPPPRTRPAVVLHPGETLKYLAEARATYMRGLLKVMKGERDGAADMHDAVAAVELTQASSAARAFWWIAQGFCEAVEIGRAHV